VLWYICDIPENIHKKIITVGKKNCVAYFYSYKTQRVDKIICNYRSARKFAITLALNVLSEKFAQIIRYQHLYPKNLVCLFVFLALQPILFVFSQPDSGL